jgi:hypothetical protein
LDAVEEVLPTQVDMWKPVEEHYNRYAVRFHRKERTQGALRTHFRKLAWGPASGGGERNEFEQRAKEIEGMMNRKGGVVLVGAEDDVGGVSPSSSSTSSSLGNSQQPKKRSSRLGFEKMIQGHLELEAQKSEDRHNEKMELFQKFLEKF